MSDLVVEREEQEEDVELGSSGFASADEVVENAFAGVGARPAPAYMREPGTTLYSVN